MRGNASSARNGIGRCDGCDKSAHALAAARNFSDLPLEDLLRRELTQLEVARRRVEKEPLRDDPNYLAPGDLRSFGFGPHLHEIERRGQRGLLGIDEVHRYLGLSVDLQPETLYILESAGGSADRLGDVLRDLKIGGWAEVDVVRNEERTRADRDCAARRVDLRWPKVGVPRRILAELLTQSAQFASTHVG